MRKLVLISLLLLPFLSFSQIEIKQKKENKKLGEINPGVWLMSLEYVESANTFLFLYRNLKYQSITDIKYFTIDSSDIDKFYSSIIQNLGSSDKKEFEINLKNGDKLTMTFEKKKVQFTVWNGTYLSYSQYVSKKQINKLFAKQEE